MIRINATEKARLPTNVRPNHYHLTIRPKFRDFTFSGIETVDVQVYERTKKIVLNSLDIAIQSASFVANNEGELNLFSGILCVGLFVSLGLLPN